MSHKFEKFSPPRELSESETNILQRLLSVDFPGRSNLLQQLGFARVVDKCQGCGTMGLTVDQQSGHAADVMRRVPVEAEALDSDGGKIHLLLHVVGGFLSEIDIFREDGGDVQRLPEPGQLTVITPDGPADS